MIKHFQENKLGTDYVVGDIHGCFDAVQKELDLIGFDPEKDRLFSVGDLVDRGTQSEESIDWLAKPWFHAVRGNHEQMAIDYIDGQSDRYMYSYNGGQWFLDVCDVDRRIGQNIAEKFRQLPIGIAVHVGNKTYGVVHADVPGGCWKKFEGNSDNESYQNVAMWDRSRIQNKSKSFVENVELVYVGHTPLKEVTVLGNVIYIDTGAVFGHGITILEMY
jgi:serine/threonine protein phosphatase 1